MTSIQVETPRSDTPLPIGITLGNYRVVRLLGEGGMGAVYEAVHTQIGRTVALKVLKSEWTSRRDVVDRFFAEARAVNEIRHPNIIDISDLGEQVVAKQTVFYVVMELLRGEDLADYIKRRGPLEVPDALQIIEPVLDALAAVHARSIVHRDLKSENIFLHTPEDGDARVIKLLDFGLVKAYGERQDAALTGPGLSVGSPHYMSPEQCLTRPVDPRSDIYSLGVVLFNMLTAHVPFDSQRIGEILVAHVKEPPPSASRLRGAPLPAPMEAVLSRCLAKEPDDRFGSVDELRQALRAVARENENESTADVAPVVGATSVPAARPPVSRTGPGTPLSLRADQADDAQLRPPRPRGAVPVVLVLLALVAGALLWWRLRAEPSPSAVAGSVGSPGATAAVADTIADVRATRPDARSAVHATVGDASRSADVAQAQPTTAKASRRRAAARRPRGRRARKRTRDKAPRVVSPAIPAAKAAPAKLTHRTKTKTKTRTKTKAKPKIDQRHRIEGTANPYGD